MIKVGKKVSVLCVPTCDNGAILTYLEEQGFEQTCIDKRETYYTHSKLLDKKTMEKITQKIGELVCCFYEEEIDEEY